MPPSEAKARARKRAGASTLPAAALAASADASAVNPACVLIELGGESVTWMASGPAGTPPTLISSPATIAWPEPNAWAVGADAHARRLAAAADTTSEATGLWLCDAPAAWARAEQLNPHGSKRLAEERAVLAIGLLLAHAAGGATAADGPTLLAVSATASANAQRALLQAATLAGLGKPFLLASDWLLAQAVQAERVSAASPPTDDASAAPRWLQLRLGWHQAEATLVEAAAAPAAEGSPKASHAGHASVLARAARAEAGLAQLAVASCQHATALWQGAHGDVALDAVGQRRIAEAATACALRAWRSATPQGLELPALALSPPPTASPPHGAANDAEPRVIGLNASIGPEAVQPWAEACLQQIEALVAGLLAHAQQAGAGVAGVVAIVEEPLHEGGEAIAEAAMARLQAAHPHWQRWPAPGAPARLAAAQRAGSEPAAERSFSPQPQGATAADGPARRLALPDDAFAQLQQAVRSEQAAAQTAPGADVADGDADGDADIDASSPGSAEDGAMNETGARGVPAAIDMAGA